MQDILESCANTNNCKINISYDIDNHIQVQDYQVTSVLPVVSQIITDIAPICHENKICIKAYKEGGTLHLVFHFYSDQVKSAWKYEKNYLENDYLRNVLVSSHTLLRCTKHGRQIDYTLYIFPQNPSIEDFEVLTDRLNDTYHSFKESGHRQSMSIFEHPIFVSYFQYLQKSCNEFPKYLQKLDWKNNDIRNAILRDYEKSKKYIEEIDNYLLIK